MAPFDVVFTDFDVVEPDLLYMSHDERTGVQEYWFVDPDVDAVRIYRSLTTPLFPGLEMSLSRIFSE